MTPQSGTRLIQWQDLKVRSEADIVLDLGKRKGWTDCEVFGHGAMITQSRETAGWKLIPADLFEYSIPAEGVSRVIQVVQAGVQIKGIIIADDVRRRQSAEHGWHISLEPLQAAMGFLGRTLAGIAVLAIGVGILFLLAKIPFILIVFTPLVLLGLSICFDPKLVILVDDGSGDTVWLSILTWYE